MMSEELREVVEILGTNFNIGVYVENQEDLKTLDVYKEALYGVVNKNHSTNLLRALTHNLITDFKRFKVDTTKYGSADDVINKVRTSEFTLVDAFTALCEVSLTQDECKEVELADDVIGHFTRVLTTSLKLSEDLYSYLAYADDIRQTFESELEELKTVEEKAAHARACLTDILHQLVPTPVSDVGDFADNGEYMCGVYLNDVDDVLSLLPDADMKNAYWNHFKALYKCVEFYKDECDEVMGRMEDFAYDDGQFNDEEVMKAVEEILELSRAYVDKYREYDSHDCYELINPEFEPVGLVESIGKWIGSFYKELVITPILNGVKKGMQIHYPNAVVNRFDEEEVNSLVLTLITAKLNLHDKMVLMSDGDMVVSYDGSEIDEDVHATISNIYHENESEAEANNIEANRKASMADILLDTRDVSEGWVNAVFGIYSELTKHI